MQKVAYYAPTSLDEAVALLERYGGEARALAGGQSLVPMMNLGLAQPRALVDLARIPDLREISGGDVIVVGALTTHGEIERSALLQEQCPLLPAAACHIAHRQIRNRGTLGGSLAHADPAAEWPMILSCLDGRIRTHSRAGERVVSAGEFFGGPYATALTSGELVLGVEIPALPRGHGWSLHEIARRPGDFALVGAAAQLTRDGAGRVGVVRLALTGVGVPGWDATPQVAHLTGTAPSAAAFREAAARVAAELDPPGDVHASGPYRRKLAAELSFRALAEAWQRAGGPDPV